MQPPQYYSRYAPAPGTATYPPSSLTQPHYVYPSSYPHYATHPVPYSPYVTHPSQYAPPPQPMHMPPPPPPSMLPPQAMYPGPAPPTFAAPSYIAENSKRDAFYRKLHAFRDAIGEPIQRLPTLGFKELDLWVLYKEVIKRRGIDAVIAKKQWKEVAEALQLPSSCTDSGFRLRLHYKKYLEAFERKFYEPPPLAASASLAEPKDAARSAQSSHKEQGEGSCFTTDLRRKDESDEPAAPPAAPQSREASPPREVCALREIPSPKEQPATASSSFASLDSAATLANDPGHESAGSLSNDSDGMISKPNVAPRLRISGGLVKKKKRSLGLSVTRKGEGRVETVTKPEKCGLASTLAKHTVTPNARSEQPANRPSAPASPEKHGVSSSGHGNLNLLEAAARTQMNNADDTARRKRVDFSVLDSATLRRYARAHGMGGGGGKEALADCVGEHFSATPLSGGETTTVLRFIQALRRR